MKPKEITTTIIYGTSDGCTFLEQNQAEKHQNKLNDFAHRTIIVNQVTNLFQTRLKNFISKYGVSYEGNKEAEYWEVVNTVISEKLADGRIELYTFENYVELVTQLLDNHLLEETIAIIKKENLYKYLKYKK